MHGSLIHPTGKSLAVALVLALLGAGCGASAAPSSLHAGALDEGVEDVLTEDTTVHIGSGTITALAGFRRRVFQDGHVVLTGPEGDLRMAFFVAPTSTPREELVRNSWSRFAPGVVLTLDGITDAPPERGWTSITVFRYPVDASTSRIRQAIVFAKDDETFVVMIDGALAGVERRGANMMTTLGSLTREGIGDTSWRGRTVLALDEAKRAEFRAFVQRAMEGFGVPGAAVGYVHGEEVYAEGFGVREAGHPEPVTSDTLFMIGSTTKSFLTLLQARLVDRGVLRWDEPLHEILPSFDFADHAVAQQVLLRHTVCACTGMPRHDYETFFNIPERTAEGNVVELARLSPTTGFGETFQYSNQLVAVGGYATAHRLHPELPLFDAWDRSVRDEVLNPLGMTLTTTRISEAVRHPHAMPHSQDWQGNPRAFDLQLERGIEAFGPCGALWSNVDEMLRYVRMSLAEGVLEDGTRLVSEANYRMRETPGVQISTGLHYGLGLVVDTSHEVMRAGHGGATFGFNGSEGWYRELGIGLVVLTNARGAEGLSQLIEAKLTELVLGLEPTADANLEAALVSRRQEMSEAAERTNAAPDLAPLRPWLGHYTTDAHLDFTLREDHGTLVLDEGTWNSRVGLAHNPTDPLDQLVLLDAPFAGVSFSRREEAGSRVLILEAGQSVYRFVQGSSPSPAH